METSKTVSLNTVQETFAQFPLDRVLFGLNRAYCRWRRGDTAFNINLLQKCEPENPMFYWFIAETARHAIAWSIRRRYDSPIQLNYGAEIPQAKLDHLIELAVSAQLDLRFRSSATLSRLSTDPLLDIGCRLILPQHLSQRTSQFRVGQTRLLYDTAPKRRAQRDSTFPLEAYSQTLISILGCELDFFLLSCLQLQGISLGENPCISIERAVPVNDRRYDTTFYSILDSGMITPFTSSVIQVLSTSPQESIANARQQLERQDEFVMVDCPNPLLTHPLIRPFPDRADYALAPVPHLVSEWLYEPLIQQLFLRCAHPFTQKHLSDIFEEYVGLVAELCAPDKQPWMHESQLQMGYTSSVVDWVKECGDFVILIDAKRTFMENLDKYQSLPEDWNARVQYWIKGVQQAARFWENVQQGQVPSLVTTQRKKAIAVIVTHMDSDYRALHGDTKTTINAAWSHSGAPSPIPWVVLSIDRYEHLMSHWSQSESVTWLADMLWEVSQTEDPKKILNKLSREVKSPISAEEDFLITAFVEGVDGNQS